MIDPKYGRVKLESRPDLDASDEPCFVLRAQDAFAVGFLKFYFTFFSSVGKTGMVDKLRLCIDRFIAWPTKKIPD